MRKINIQIHGPAHVVRLCVSVPCEALCVPVHCIPEQRGNVRGVTGQCKVGAARMQLMLRSRGGLAVEQA